jgi:hypothetical protein
VTVIGPVGVATAVVVVGEDRVEVESVVEIERVPVDPVRLDVLNELDVLVEIVLFNIYKLSLLGPPQYSRVLPVQIMSHPLVAGTKLV